MKKLILFMAVAGVVFTGCSSKKIKSPFPSATQQKLDADKEWRELDNQ